MGQLWEQVTSPSWLISVVLVSFLMSSLAAAYAKARLDALIGKYSTRRRNLSEKARARHEMLVARLTRDPLIYQEYQFTSVKGLVLTVAAVGAIWFTVILVALTEVAERISRLTPHGQTGERVWSVVWVATSLAALLVASIVTRRWGQHEQALREARIRRFRAARELTEQGGIELTNEKDITKAGAAKQISDKHKGHAGFWIKILPGGGVHWGCPSCDEAARQQKAKG